MAHGAATEVTALDGLEKLGCREEAGNGVAGAERAPSVRASAGGVTVDRQVHAVWPAGPPYGCSG